MTTAATLYWERMCATAPSVGQAFRVRSRRENDMSWAADIWRCVYADEFAVVGRRLSFDPLDQLAGVKRQRQAFFTDMWLFTPVSEDMIIALSTTGND